MGLSPTTSANHKLLNAHRSMEQSLTQQQKQFAMRAHLVKKGSQVYSSGFAFILSTGRRKRKGGRGVGRGREEPLDEEKGVGEKTTFYKCCKLLEAKI